MSEKPFGPFERAMARRLLSDPTETLAIIAEKAQREERAAVVEFLRTYARMKPAIMLPIQRGYKLVHMTNSNAVFVK